MARNLCRLPPEWCNYISQLCQQFDDKQPSPPSRITFGDCPQRLESYVQTPLMYLMPPIILWSPLEQFPMMKTKLCTCPKCNSGEVILHPSTWRDGTKSRRSEPRKVYGEDGVTLLVGRVYTCSKGHEVIGYHPSILEKIPACFIPFDLWHITGFTRKASLSIISLITSGISIHGISEILFQKQTAWYCCQRNKYLELCGRNASSFPSLSTWQQCFPSSLPSQHVVAGCFLDNFWTKEAIYKKHMLMTSIDDKCGWLSCDHTFASAGKYNACMANKVF